MTKEFYRPTTNTQRFYIANKRPKAEIDVCLTHESEAPSIEDCRHAVLLINNGAQHQGYVIYDRLLCRIVNGVYYGTLDMALESAQAYNEENDYPQDMAPSGAALGLKYPKVSKEKNVPIVIEGEG